MARNNVQTTVHVGMDVQLAKRNAEALKEVIATLKKELKEQRAIMESPVNLDAYQKAEEAVKKLTLQIQTLQKVQRSATPAAAYESYISGDMMNSNTLRQAQRGAKNRLNTVPVGSSDKTTRTFINDINRMTMELNRLQAGFSKPLRSVKKELRDLSGSELQRLHQLLQQEQTLVEGNDRAWANYAAAIAKVEERMREYDTLARQTVGASTLKQSQKGVFVQANERDIQRAIDKLKEYRAVINDPNGKGKGIYEATNAEIQKLQAQLDGLRRKAAEASGQAMGLTNAFRVGLQALNGTFKGTSAQLEQAKKALQEQLTLTEHGTRRYKQLKSAIEGIETEEKRLGMTAREVDAVLDSPKGKSFKELKIAIEQGRLALANMRTDTKEGKKAFDELAAKVKAADIEMKKLEKSSKGTATAFEKAWSRLKTYVGLYMGAAVAIQKLTGAMGDLMELSDKMGEVRKTTGFTAEEVGHLTTELKKMDTRTSITGLLELSVAAGQLGLKTQEDVEGFTEAANKLMVALPEMGREGATEMLKVALATGEIDKIRKQMEQGLIEGSSATAVAMEKVGSTIDRLRATSAATAPAITDFVKRVGAVGAQSGITIDQVAALGSTVDALGMRVEMSATALSRMIPAIRNNAYSIGAMIGKTEEEIIRKFDNGMGMDVILDIFETIRRNSRSMTGDVEQDAEDIEKMFEKAGLKEIMKELNQMGARAGIVFAGLSQNVDELRRQLGVAAEAYEENIAIEKEYQKMNETTAAKWERLKNQVEEFFVGDDSQRILGSVIDALRWIIDKLTGEGGVSEALRTVIIYLAAVRVGLAEGIVKALTGVWNGIKNIGVALGVVKGQMTAMNYANIFMAIGTAVLYATKCFGLLGKEASFSDRELAKADKAIADATEKLDRMFVRLNNLSTAVRRATEETQHLEEGSDKLAQAEEKAAMATEARKKTIDAINNAYGQYLGFMLTEYDRAELIAAAHDKITAALKREMYARQQQQSMQAVSDEYTPKILDEWANTRQSLREKGVESQVISELFENVQAIIDATKFDPNTGKFNIENEQYSTLQEALGEQVMANVKGFDELIATYMYRQLATRTQLTLDDLKDLTGMRGLKSTDRGNVYAGADATMYVTEGELGENNVRQGLMDVYTEFIQKRDEISAIFTASIGRWATKERKASITLIDELKKKVEAQLTTIGTSKDQTAIDQAYQELAQALLGLDNQIKILDSNVDAAIIDSIKALADKANQSADATKLTQARATALSIFARATSNNNNNNQNNYNPIKPRGPYGNYDKRVDPYEQWDANALVKRREEMLMRVRALANGADVQQVLSMDKRFMDEATRKGIKNMRDAIAWYNEERLKIQEELHSRNLTNTGDWLEPKKGGSKRKPKTPESESAIAELDRYYLERKELIEEARSNEEMTDAEYNRRLDALEMEHLQKRSDLRKTFTSEDKKFIEQFRKWWASVEELDEVSWEIIEAEWNAAWERDRKYNKREAQKDLTQMQAITVKQLKEIEAIIDKERPFNGITTNLQDNLTKMGLLFKDGVSEEDKFMEQNTKRLTFLLREAENAYAMTWEQLADDMRKNGLGSWADAIIDSENAEKEKRAIIAQLHEVYDAVQEAIKKEASLVKKQVDIQWNDAILPNGKSIKATYEAAISALGVQQSSVSRANSLIGAGTASDRVADRLAIRQMQLQLQMQEHYYNLVRKTGQQRIEDLLREAQLREQAGKTDEADRLRLDAKHAQMSLNLSLSKEETELAKQREEIIARTEESQNRLYKALKEWGDLLASSLQSLFEASNAGNAEYYNELAKLNLTGKGGPGAGTYVIIDNAGRKSATAHYEYLDELGALERQREIEQQNAVADAWKKVMDDINEKMSETITDQINAMLQNTSVDANTDALSVNTRAIQNLTEQLAVGSSGAAQGTGTSQIVTPALSPEQAQEFADALGDNPMDVWMEQSDIATQKMLSNMDALKQGQTEAGKSMSASAQSTFAKMTMAANMYGVAYQAMSNDNLSATQKFEMMALQAVGNYAISSLTTEMATASAKAATDSPGVLGTLWKQLGWAAAPVFAVFTGLLGGLMGLAASKISKAKSTIAQATGTSINAGRLATGMLTYAAGNVNEFTDPKTLTPGRQYTVDAADGRTYRARYMGRNVKTHLTNGPEFHLSGEKGREMIIDAGTTRQITMNDAAIWHAIQTLSAGGRVRRGIPVRRRGISAFADGNVEDFEEMSTTGIGADAGRDMEAMRLSLDRNSAVQEALLERLSQPIEAKFDVYGRGGLIDSYDKGKKAANRHGERY